MSARCTPHIDLCSSDDEATTPTIPAEQSSAWRGSDDQPSKRRKVNESAIIGQARGSQDSQTGSAKGSQGFAFGGFPHPGSAGSPAALPAALPRMVPLEAPEVTHVSDTVRFSAGDPGSGAAEPADTKSEVTSPTLSDEQAAVLDRVKLGKNIFFTGNAGTGKSFLLNQIINYLRSQYEEDFANSVAICASTGIAATHVGGTTVHSAFGIGIPKTHEDFAKCWKEENRKKIRAWRVLIIDEISMVSGELFEHLEHITKQVRGGEEPFGGLQIVLCGDYFQLPPIEDRWTVHHTKDCFLNRGYTFQAPAWKRCKMEEMVLTKVFRQKDQRLINILEAVRYNNGAKAAMEDLAACCSRPLPPKEGVEPTCLFSRNADVNTLNEDRLRALPGDEVTQPAGDGVEPNGDGSEAGLINEERLWRADFFRDCLASKEIKLKVGAQVMLLRNLDMSGGPQGMLVNGSRGVVIGFKSREELVGPADSEAGGPDDWCKSWKGKQIPIVRFLNGREQVITPEKFTSDVPGYGMCKRMQIPLKLAWAITIHKCQGMTLDYVKVSLRSIFATGQAYVALSRASSLEGLQVMDGNHTCVKTSPLVMHFHSCLLEGREYEEKDWDSLMELPPHSSRKGQAAGPSPSRTSFGEVSQTPPSQRSSGGRGGGFGGGGGGFASIFNRGGGGRRGGAGRMQGARGGGGGGRYGGGGSRDMSNEKCYKCKQMGHWASNCPNR